jgi:hypothetical protein
MAMIEPDSLGLLYRRHAPALRLYARQWPGAPVTEAGSIGPGAA